MKLSKKLKTKIKKRTLQTLTSVALVTITLAILKLADFSMPFSSQVNLISSNGEERASVVNHLENTDTITYIYDAEDLVAFRDAVNAGDDYSGKTVYLMDNIDLSTVCSADLGSWEPIGATGTNFAGTFDGNYHSISNLYINSSSYLYLGFFTQTAENTVVKRLEFNNVDVNNTYNVKNAENFVGTIAGISFGKILNCGINSGNIKATKTATNTSACAVKIGGVVGSNIGTIDGCYNKATIDGNSVQNSNNSIHAGGIVGYGGVYSKLSNCYNTGSIISSSGYVSIGGIQGGTALVSGSTGYLKNCYNRGTITVEKANYTLYKAGINGINGWSSTYSSKPITNSYCIPNTTYSYYYYSGGVKTSTAGIVSEDTLKTYASTLGQSFKDDIFNINDGYPTLYWETPSVKLSERQKYIKVGEKIQLTIEQSDDEKPAEMLGIEINQSDFTWTSSNEEVTSVDNNGLVTGKGIGHTTITAYNEKLNLKAKAIINVYSNKEGAITVPQVEEGEGFTVVLKEDGTVWATGQNNYGQLGQGDTTNRNIPVQVKIDENTYLTNVIKISNVYAQTLALTKSGEVYAWGYNHYGQLGQGDTTNRTYATKVKGIGGEGYLENIIDIAMGHSSAIVINEDGNLFGCGYGDYYTLLGNATTYIPEELNTANAVSVSEGYNDVGVILSNGETWVWGHNPQGSLGNGSTATKVTETYLENDINEIKFEGYSGYILKEDGTIWASGLNNYGQLGNGTTTNKTTYTQIKFENGDEAKAKTIEAGSKNLQFIGEDGKVYVTGYNGNGQLGDKTTTNEVYPKVMVNEDGTEVTDAISLIAGTSVYNALPRNMGVIRNDGTVWLSGDNTYGQIGNASNTSTNYLTKLGNSEVILNKRNEYIKTGDTIDIDVLTASKFNVFIQDTPNQSDWIWTSSNEDVATIDNDGIVTGKTVGHTTITGYNSKLGLKAKAIINVYRNKEGAITVPQVEEGEGYSIVLKEDGTVWATGQNNYGQLGQGDTTNRNTSVQVKIDENTYLTNVIKISSSSTHTLALTRNGEVYAWGYNNHGQLGQGDTTSRTYATKVRGVNGEGYLEDIIDISMGSGTAIVVNSEGYLYGWGYGAVYTLFENATIYNPIKLKNISSVISINVGYSDANSILSNGETWIWGHNGYGELGNGSTTNNGVAERCLANDINEIKFDGYSGYILKEDGSVWGSGLNNYGQLGLGDTTNRTTYTQIKFEDGTELKAKTIEAGAKNLAVIGTDGKVYVTGYNGNGQLGDKTTTNAVYPKVMTNEDGTEVTDAILLIAGSGVYTSTPKIMGIIRQDGTVWLAGDNTYGQIGNASNTSTNYLTKMGDGFLNYPEKWITIGVNESKKINPLLFNIEEDMNVFVDNNSSLGELTYEIEDNQIAEVTTLGMITGLTQGITKVKVTDNVTEATTNIWVKVVEDKNINIDLGYKFTVALKQDGSVWSWGENHVGQLGLGNTTYYNEPQKITGITEKITDVKSGYYHSIALTENGEVYTWGYNYYGQCGNGTTQNVLTPVKIPNLTNIVKINAYKYMTIALTQSGEVYVWGNGYGSTPVKLKFTRKIIDVAGNIVLAENRRAYNLTETTSYGKDLIKISAGENHYLGLTADGEVYAWGTNNYGQLGNGNNTSSNIPTKVVTPDGTANISNIVEISAGNHYSIISDKDGKVYTFGYYGNYRTANTTNTNKPVEITDLNKIELVAGSEGGHTAIVDWDGYVYTVGLNDAGQLGLKDNAQRSSFEMVGELQIECNPSKITLHVGETQDVNLTLSSSFNLKSDSQNTSSVNKTIANEAIASLSGDTVTALSIGKTILNATYEGTIGNVNTEIQKFYRNIEIEVLPEGGIVVPKVEAGNGFTISLKADGTVWSWGQNQYGQLGLGNTVSYNEPQKVSIIKETITNADGSKTEVQDVIKDIAVGDYQVLALSESGKVYTWGLGNYGQLGVGNGYSYYTPVIATDIYGTQLTDIVKVEAGENISFAINSKGVVYVWGKGYTSRAQKLDVAENIIDVTSKYVLSGDGKVYNISNKEKLALVGKVVELDEGTNHTVILTSEGKAYAIGDNTYGQLANGNNIPSEDTPVAVRVNSENLFTGIKEIKAGDKTTTIVTTDGKVWTAGMNDNNELGIENTEILDRNLPEANTNINNVIFADPGYNHVVVVKEDGTVYAWGNGKQGELGNRTNKNSITPVMVGDYIVRTNTNRVILQVNEEKIVEGYVDYFNIFNQDIKNINYTSKDSSVVSLTDTQGNNTQNATLNSNSKFEIKLTGKKTGTAIVTANQENAGNIGVIQVEVVPETQTASDLGITISPNVITNGSHTISLRVDGKVFTWGDNTYGQLGNGTTTSSDEPVEVTFPEGTIVTEIASGENHNVALDSEGNVWTWGRNNNYQIGHSGGNQYTPYKVTGLPKVIRIAAGNNNTMVITENNELYAWGLNAYGDLGLGTYTNKVLPSKVTGIGDIIDIAGGKSHFMLLNRAGEVYTTGSNLYGQLGIGVNEINKINEFRKLNISEKIGTINSGDISNVVTTVDGYVYSWGGNTYGQLGTGDKENKNIPTKIKNVQNIRQAESGKTHTALRDGNNTVFVTGTNTDGQLGIGTKENKVTFEQNQMISNVIRVSAGNTYTTLLKEDGFVWACGDYNHGEKTKKSKTKAKVPVLVGSDTSSLETMEIVLMKSEIQNIMANAKFKFNLIYIEENDTSDFSYSSYNEEIAKIDEDGDILGIREGTTWVKVTDGKTGKEHIAIVRVIDNNTEYTTHVAPNVIAGENFVIGLKEDGTAWTWGYDSTGLADTNVPINTNVLSTYKMIDAGKNHGVAIRTDGTVWAVGDNSYGQLGLGSLENKSKLVQVEGLTDIIQVAAGETHSLVIDSYGIVYGWGSNANGELSSEYVGQDTKLPVVITIPNERIMQISAGKNQSAFVTSNGTVYGMGSILNGYIPNVYDAVKVDVGDNYILVLRADGSIYKYQYGVLTKVSNVLNAIDISVQNKVNAYQSVDEKAYTWGTNTNGQLGNNSTQSVSTPVQVKENGTNVFRVGSGYNNTFTVLNTGFVYAAGNNTYGELGNGTSENETSTTKDNSLVHTLVGDRNFEINPENNTLEINEVEDVGVTSNTFNVFSNKQKDLSEYEWKTEDGTIVTVLGDGEIQGINIGTTKLQVTDKVTGETKEGTRVVVPVDTDRIESITASGKDAEVTEAYKYEARVPVDETTTTSQVAIKTKLGTDQISVDGGTTWQTGSITTTVDITNDSTTVPFIVKTEAGNELNYTLTIIRESNDNTISSITVKKAGETVETPVNQVSSKVYEIVVPNTGVNKVKVTANHSKAQVSIKGLTKELKEQSYNLVMTKPVEELPIKITSESGKEENYTLKVYTKDYVATLNKVFVNGVEATKVDDTNYEITITDEIDLSSVKVITNLSTSKVGINGGTKQESQVVENVSTVDNVTTVTIQVESEDGTIAEEYTLTINKQRINSKIQELQVEGQTIKEINNVYTAYVTSDVNNATVKITAKDTAYYITLADFEEKNYTITESVKVNADTNTYEIQVRDDVSGEIANYTLIIKRGDTEVGIKNIFAVNENIVKYATQVSDTEYEIRVLSKYTDTNLSINSINTASKIAIGQEDIDAENYAIGTNTKTISITEKETIVPVVVTTADGGKTKEYTVKIVRVSDDTTLNMVAVNELLGGNDIVASLSTTEADTYEVQLQNAVKLVNVIASTTNENAEIKIADNSYVINQDTKEIAIDSSITEVKITVKSEYGTEKEYTLRINTLPEEVGLQTITVGGVTATYNSVLGRYEARVNNTLTSYDITAIAKDSLTNVKVDASTGSVNGTGTAQATESKAGETTIVPITIKAQNGINEATYNLAIIEKSSNANIGVVKVNGVEITADGEGNYTANVKSTVTEAEIFVQAENEYAKVTADGTTKDTNNVTITRTITGSTTVYTIKVVSEDGTNTVEKNLTINRLSGNTNISSVTVATPDGATYTPALQEDGTYYVKVKRQDTADVTVTLEDAKASVTIAGGTTKLQERTETVTLLDEITEVNVLIEAEDGTQNTGLIKIEKESNDASLLRITSEDAIKVSYIGSNKYEIQVYDTATELTINAETTNKFARIKLGTEADTEYVVNKMENKAIDLTTGITSFTINVLAEDGEISKTYTIEITKKFNTKIESIVVDDENTTKNENVYTGWANNDNTANIVITPDNMLAKVRVYKGSDLVGEGTGEIILGEEMLDKTATYKIIVSNPDNEAESSTYILNITKKSTNNNIEYVKVNGETLIENVDTASYETEVVSVNGDNYVLEVKAEDEYATIKFDEGEYSELNLQTKEYVILPGETKEVVVTVKSQNGEEIIKTVKIYRKDNNLNVATLKVNEIDIVASYDAVHKNYSVTLDNTLTSTNLEIVLESDKSKMNTTIDSNTYENVTNISVDNVSLPGIGKKVITFTVTSEEGTSETRTITISQFSSNIELEEVKVNGKVAEKLQDGNYEITIGDSSNIATIYAKAKENTTSVGINGSTSTVESQTINIQNIVEGQYLEVPIKLTSADGNEYEYKLYITVKSGNNNLDTVKVNNIDATKLDDTIYRMFVNQADVQATVDITAASESSVVKVMVNNVEQAGNPLNFIQSLPQEKTNIIFTIISESGEEKEYTLEIIKESSDNTLKNVYVNGIELQKDETTGRYKTTLNEEDGNPVVKVITNNEFAYVRIALFEEEQTQSEKMVQLSDNKITTVPITVRSQTGITNVEYLDIEKIYTTTNIDTLVVDGSEITNYNENSKTYTAIIDANIEEHEIFIMAGNTYATIEINEDIGVGNVTSFTTMEDEEYYKIIPFTVTSESNEVQDYKLTLVKKSTNVNITEIVVNDVTLLPDEDKPDIYRKTIKKLANKAKIKVTTEYPYASVKIGDCDTQIGTSEVWIDLSLTQDEITIPVLVTATDGKTIATYNIILKRLSNDTSATVSYDGVELVKNEKGKYNVSILDTVTEGLIKVVTNDTEAKADIANTLEYSQGGKEYNLNIDTQTAGRTIEVPISIVSADETIENSTLVITRISTNNKTAKVEGTFDIEGVPTTKEATIDEDGNYFIGVKEATDKVTLKITPESEYATVTRETETGVGILETEVTLTGKITYVNYKVTSESGEENTYTVKIVRQSEDTSIAKLTVDGKEIEADENGIYNAEVEGGTTEAKVIVTLTSDLAKAQIGTASNTGVLTTQVEVTNVENTYKVKVTAEDGTTKEYTLKITRQTNIAGTILTENTKGKHSSQVIIYKSSDTRTEDIDNILNTDGSVNTNVRQPVEQVETKEDGTFVAKVTDIEKYDIVGIKKGYLSYRVTGIEVVKGEKTVLDEYILIAGNVVTNSTKSTLEEQIEIDDLVTLNDNIGEVITDANKEAKGIYDLNEDGVVNQLDRNILKKNYGKKAETVEWVNPNATMSISMMNLEVEEVNADSTTIKTDFIIPMTCSYTITSEYGYRVHPTTGEYNKHTGIDLAGTHHTEILAVADGEVTYAGVQSGFGNCVEIKHIVNGETIYSFYAHLSRIDVKQGDTVKQGEVIGLEGGDPDSDPNPGSSTGHHLHFEIRNASGYGNDVDPNDYIKF